MTEHKTEAAVYVRLSPGDCEPHGDGVGQGFDASRFVVEGYAGDGIWEIPDIVICLLGIGSEVSLSMRPECARAMALAILANGIVCPQRN
jgi:hypothetical protein